jgi:hypothetical protein
MKLLSKARVPEEPKPHLDSIEETMEIDLDNAGMEIFVRKSGKFPAAKESRHALGYGKKRDREEADIETDESGPIEVQGASESGDDEYLYETGSEMDMEVTRNILKAEVLNLSSPSSKSSTASSDDDDISILVEHARKAAPKAAPQPKQATGTRKVAKVVAKPVAVIQDYGRECRDPKYTKILTCFH